MGEFVRQLKYKYLDLKEHCSYPVHARLQPSKGSRTRRSARRLPGPPRAEVAVMPDLPTVDLPEESKRLHHAQLYYKPFQSLLRVVFVLDAEAHPVTLFATDPEMALERIYCIYRDRFPIEFHFRDAKQHLGLAACQARTATRHHFHVNAVLAALAWTRLEPRHAADRALDRFSMANVKLKSFLELVLNRLLDTDGLGLILQQYNTRGPAGPARSGPNRAAAALNPSECRANALLPPPFRPPLPHPTGRGGYPCISQKLFTPLFSWKESLRPE